MIALLMFFAPSLLLLAGLVALWAPGAALRLAEPAALAGLGASLLGAGLLALSGPQVGPVLGPQFGGFALAVQAQMDVVSVVMACLVSFTGWIVVRFAQRYTLGEPWRPQFLAWLLLTLSAVLWLVSAAQLAQMAGAWIAMGAGLRQLILTYPARASAQRAAQKRGLSNLVSSGALILGFGLIWAATGSSALADIRLAEATPLLIWGAACLAVAAVLSVALLPFHGWLLEAIDAPTPVSALLHAGLVNAGGFLLIRFADVLTQAPGVLSVLVGVGGASALIGGLVMLTQPAVKTALAWSTVAQMGFMILQCGLALWPLALLHIVAHSMYKAHAFLSSGGAVEAVLATRRPGPVAVPSLWAVARAFGLALAIFAAVALMFGLAGKSPQAIALGAILVFGVAYLIAQGLADAAPGALTRRVALASVAATVAYFSLQLGAAWLTRGTLPPPPLPGALEWVLISLALLSFGAVALAQATFPLWAQHPAVTGLRVHLMNGLYLNALLDRALSKAAQKSTQESAK